MRRTPRKPQKAQPKQIDRNDHIAHDGKIEEIYIVIERDANGGEAVVTEPAQRGLFGRPMMSITKEPLDRMRSQAAMLARQTGRTFKLIRLSGRELLHQFDQNGDRPLAKPQPKERPPWQTELVAFLATLKDEEERIEYLTKIVRDIAGLIGACCAYELVCGGHHVACDGLMIVA